MIDLSEIQSNYAIFTPALSPNCSQFPFTDVNTLSRPLPGELTLNDFDMLRPNNLFKMSHVLYSAGHSMEHEHRPCMVMNRDRTQSIVIGDSGGFQVIKGILPPYTPGLVHRILRYLENMADVAMTCDVPTNALLHPEISGYQNFQQCLDQSMANLAIFSEHRQNTRMRFLNVLQGRNYEEADVWYNSVRSFQFEGWAFAGPTRLDFYFICNRILQMIERGDIHEKSWLHFLGVSFLECAVVLTALKRSLRSAGLTNVEISFDSSSAIQTATKYKRAIIGPKYGTNNISLQRHQFPFERHTGRVNPQFPFTSPIGSRICVSDLYNNEVFDGIGGNILTNHNIFSELSSIIEVNRVVDIGERLHEAIPIEIQSSVEAIHNIFNDTNRSGHHLRVNRKFLSRFTPFGNEELRGEFE